MDNTKAYELSRHSDYMAEREKYLIYKAGYDTVKGYPQSLDSFAYHETLTIPVECFDGRVGEFSIVMYIDGYLPDGSSERFYRAYRANYWLGYIRQDDTILLIDDPYYALYYYT